MQSTITNGNQMCENTITGHRNKNHYVQTEAICFVDLCPTSKRYNNLI